MQKLCILVMKKKRQQEILGIISAKKVATQQELAAELSARGMQATQSSVSRDVVEMGLSKLNGYYFSPKPALAASGPVLGIDTAGDNLIVIKTDAGQASPAALAIDRAKIDEVIGTVAGDDTIFVAVKNLPAQRIAIKKIVKLFARPAGKAARATRGARSAAGAAWSW
jgi:transcriptional regulator of arginine metabolism